jgi:hypothetical protein
LLHLLQTICKTDSSCSFSSSFEAWLCRAQTYAPAQAVTAADYWFQAATCDSCICCNYLKNRVWLLRYKPMQLPRLVLQLSIRPSYVLLPVRSAAGTTAEYHAAQLLRSPLNLMVQCNYSTRYVGEWTAGASPEPGQSDRADEAVKPGMAYLLRKRGS